ncbi:hypothetical protein HanPSC8_Chr13g0587921 [Helianthus annuus]|nr:hypothetical protein HanPSC8_Chr13g0587921 [Helianthus annuus]
MLPPRLVSYKCRQNKYTHIFTFEKYLNPERCHFTNINTCRVMNFYEKRAEFPLVLNDPDNKCRYIFKKQQ